MPRPLRHSLFGLLAAIWLGAPFAARHPIVDAMRSAPEASPLERWIEELDGNLPEEVDIALWWPERGPEGLASLSHLWAWGGYTLTPRRVYPLLTPEEARTVEPLDEKIRLFLVDRAEGLQTGRVGVPVVVLAWGDGDCFLEAFPRLVKISKDGPGCLLELKSQDRTP